jgi:hypothetical protein
MVFVPFLVLVLFACQLHHEIMFFLYHIMCIGWDELEQSFDVSGSNSWEQEFHYHGHVFPPCVCVAVSGALIKVSEQKWNEISHKNFLFSKISMTIKACARPAFSYLPLQFERKEGNDDEGSEACVFSPFLHITPHSSRQPKQALRWHVVDASGRNSFKSK